MRTEARMIPLILRPEFAEHSTVLQDYKALYSRDSLTLPSPWGVQMMQLSGKAIGVCLSNL